MDPFGLEQTFHALVHSLPIYASKRLRIHRICDFLEPFVSSRDRLRLEAYGPELLQELFRNLPLLEAEGTSTAFFERIVSILDGVEAVSPDLFRESNSRQIRDLASSLKDRSTRFIAERRANGYLDHPALVPKHSSSAWIPMIVAEPLLTQHFPEFALLRELTIELSPRKSDDNKDVIFLDQSADPDGRHREVISQSLRVARGLIERQSGRKPAGQYNVHCRFDEPNTVVGESMGLGAAAASFCELLRVSGSRQQISLSSGVAFTGTLSDDGSIEPVDEGGLRLKIETCIYSHLSFIVIPRCQIKIAEEFLSGPSYTSISGALPILIGIDRLEEVFYDRRISIVVQIPSYRLAVRNVWRQRRPLAAALILLLAGLLAYQIFGPFDRNPQFAEFADKWLIVRNKYHAVLARFDVGRDIVNTLVDPPQESIPRHGCQFYDVDGDGTNEMFFRSAADGNPTDEKLVCRSIRNGGINWEKSIRRKLSFPRKPDIESEAFSIPAFLVGKFDGDGRPEVILIANHTFFPSLIVKLDARTGEELGEYLHIGQLGDLNSADLDGDGVPEIIACGVNNAFRKAAIVVLDARTMGGCSPTRGDYFPDPYIPGKEKGYILVPRTIAGEAVGVLSANNGARSVEIDSQGSRIVIRIVDFSVDLPQFGITSRADLIYYFDFKMHLIRVGTTSQYDLMAERMVQQGWLKQVPDKAYFDSYRGSIERWDGIRFVQNTSN